VSGSRDTGEHMHAWARDLWAIPRSLTGDGVRETLKYLQRLVPEIECVEVPTGTRVLDWEIPDEWEIRGAWIEDDQGRRVVDWADNNLHVVGYSTGVDSVMSRDELEPHLHSLHDDLDAIPYVTSYYKRTWGFCLSHRVREALGAGPFRVHIDAEHRPGSLTYGHCLIEGETDREVLLSSYICHPGMANNELSGPVVLAAIGQWLRTCRRRRYSYRLVWVPETIGAIAYVAEHGNHLKEHVDAGWVLTCIGDERAYSMVPSRLGDTVADRITRDVLASRPNATEYSFLDRGSDERQWCAPGVDLPIASIMRSKYHTYPEYHTSRDDLTLVTPLGLAGGLEVALECIQRLERETRWRSAVDCEPQLGRRGMYPTTSYRGSADAVRDLMNVLAYCDGSHDLNGLARRTGLTPDIVADIISKLEDAQLVEPVPN
jgi:aminopeptidase-like protein